MYPNNYCYECYTDDFEICVPCSELNDICLNCILYGIDEECLNCATNDEGVDFSYDVASITDWIISNNLYWSKIRKCRSTK
jgi:hypothetical protein